MAKLNNFRGFARNISEPTHNDCLLSKKPFNSKRKIPIFHCATSKTLLANIPVGKFSELEVSFKDD